MKRKIFQAHWLALSTSLLLSGASPALAGEIIQFEFQSELLSRRFSPEEIKEIRRMIEALIEEGVLSNVAGGREQACSDMNRSLKDPFDLLKALDRIERRETGLGGGSICD